MSDRRGGIVYPTGGGGGGGGGAEKYVAPAASNVQKSSELPPTPSPTVDANPNGGTP